VSIPTQAKTGLEWATRPKNDNYEQRLGAPHNAVFVVWEMRSLRSFSRVIRKSLRPTLNIPTQVEALAPLRRAPNPEPIEGPKPNPGLEWATRPKEGVMLRPFRAEASRVHRQPTFMVVILSAAKSLP